MRRLDRRLGRSWRSITEITPAASRCPWGPTLPAEARIEEGHYIYSDHAEAGRLRNGGNRYGLRRMASLVWHRAARENDMPDTRMGVADEAKNLLYGQHSVALRLMRDDGWQTLRAYEPTCEDGRLAVQWVMRMPFLLLAGDHWRHRDDSGLRRGDGRPRRPHRARHRRRHVGSGSWWWQSRGASG